MQLCPVIQYRRSSMRALLVLVAMVLPAAGNASAQSIRRPLGLEPGEAFRLLFVTEGKRDATSSNIADYNAFVSSEAISTNSLVRDLEAEWFAIASTTNVDAIQNTGTDPSPVGDTGVPIYLVDGATRVADDYDHWWDGDSAGFSWLLNSPDLTQNGTPLNGINNVWTGTGYFGNAGGFGGPLGDGITATIGASVAGNGRHINNNFRSLASGENSLYALSSVLTAVPEPSSGALMVLASVSFYIARRRA